MTLNRSLASLIIASSAFVGVVAFVPSPASASPLRDDSSTTVTVDGTDYPVCAEEDCSDQPGQIGVWQNDGRSWLELGEDITIPIDQGCDLDPECDRPDYTN